MTEWIKAPQEVLSIAEELIELYHERLQGSGIGFVFRDEAPNSNGKVTLAKASVVPPRIRPYLDLEFMIWIAEDKWMEASPEQKRALIDHELCHCIYKDVTPAMRPHDIEEFDEILARYGLWKADLWEAKSALTTALQISLPAFVPGPESRPTRVRAIDPAVMEHA